MAYVAVNKDGTENIFNYKPIVNDAYYKDLRHTELVECWSPEGLYGDSSVRLPRGTIEKLIGRKLTWEDEPVELKDDS